MHYPVCVDTASRQQPKRREKTFVKEQGIEGRTAVIQVGIDVSLLGIEVTFEATQRNRQPFLFVLR